MPRLPQPGGDAGNWGVILNDYLSQAHTASGVLKDDSVGAPQLQDNSVSSSHLQDNSVTASALADNSVTAATIVDGSITSSQLSSSVQTSLSKADTSTQPADLATKYTKPSGGIPLSDMKRADLDNTYAPRRLPFLPLPPVAGHMMWLNAAPGNSGSSTVSYRVWHTISEDCSDLRFVYMNVSSYNGSYDVPGANDIVVKAAIEITSNRLPSSTINDAGWGIIPIYFASGRTVTIPPGGYAVSDPVPIRLENIAGGQGIYERVNVSVVDSSKTWPRSRFCDSGLASARFEAGCVGYDIVDSATALYASGAQRWEPSTSIPIYGAVAIVGRPLRPNSKRRTIALCGDSIQSGQSQVVTSGDHLAGGFGNRAFDTKAAVVHLGVGGERAFDFSSAQYQKTIGYNTVRRMMIAELCTDAFTNYGSNDVHDTTGTQTFSSVTAALQTHWRDLHLRGLDVHVTTITPRTTSTDSWATVGNQTRSSWHSLRLQINAWIRAGAPQDVTTGAAAAPGTSGAVVNPYIRTITDTSDAVETSRDSGYWKVDGNANTWTGDGTHPTAVGQAAMAAAVPVSAIINRPFET